MVTHRVAEVVKSRGDFTDEEIENLTEHEAWQWIHEQASAPYLAENEHRQNERPVRTGLSEPPG